MNYTIITKIQTIPIERIDEFRDVDRFMQYCKQCRNYNTRYSCPPHNDINDEEYLRQFSHAHFILTQIVYDEQTINDCKGDKQKQNDVLFNSRSTVLRQIEDLILSKEIKGGIAVGSSGCSVCEECGRAKGLACAHPDKMRYAIDSFGFDITKILEQLFGVELSWPKDTIPRYQCIVGMFLDDDDDFFLD